MISKKGKYGLKAMLYMARHYDQRLIIVSEISKEEYIPYKFLEKILLDLKRKGILISKIGKNGGYRHSRPPDQIFLGEVIRMLDGRIAPIPCVSKIAYERCFDCEDEDSCEIRRAMQLVRDAMVHILDNTSLQQAISQQQSSPLPFLQTLTVN